MFCSCSEDVHMVWTLSSNYCLTLQMFFSWSEDMHVHIVWTLLCENFVSTTLPTLLFRYFFKLCRCFVHGLKMCMRFGQYSHFAISAAMSGYSSYNFLLILLKLANVLFMGRKCTCGSNIIIFFSSPVT